MAEEAKESPAAADATAKQGETKPKVFTQADVDRIVSQRVNEERGKFKGYDEFRDKAQTLDNMMDDPKFQKFLEGLTEPGRKSTGEVVETGLDELPEFQELKKLDPDLAPVVVKLVTKLASDTVKKQVQPIQQETDEAKAARAVQEVQAMTADSENWPGMQSKEFQEDMSKCFMPNPRTRLPRATTLEDAYSIVERDWRRQGKEIPAAPSAKAKSKEDAELLESRAGEEESAAAEKPRKFKTPREAAEYSMKKLGWK